MKNRCACTIFMLVLSGWLGVLADDFDIGSFVDDVLTSTNDEWRVERYNVEIEVRNSQGTSLEGKKYTLRPSDRNEANVISGKIGPGNKIIVKGLVHTLGQKPLTYQLRVERNRLGRISRKSAESGKPLVFNLPVSIGDAAPDFTVQDIMTGEDVKLSDFRGEVIFIDFWTTWCGPCQKPMAHNQEIMVRKKEEWAGKARILGVSLDRGEIGKVKKHVEKKGWGDVHHTWAEGWGGQEAPDKYQVSGVPTCVLVGKSGTILWRGHPSRINIEKKIEEAILRP